MSAEILTSTVHYHDASGDLSFRGFLARPHQGDARRPGVLVVPEWWGLDAYAKHRAEQIAGLGYVALAVDMYGDGITTRDAATAAALARDTRTGAVARERINCALRVLREQPEVDPKRIAAVGFCFGGSVALELARSGAEICGAACFHGSLATPTPARPETLKASIVKSRKCCNLIFGWDHGLARDRRRSTRTRCLRSRRQPLAKLLHVEVDTLLPGLGHLC